MKFEIYTDGAYSSTLKQMGIGIVCTKDNKKVFTFSKMYSGGTNNRAELCAIIVALRMIAKPVDSIVIFSDSMYCIGTINLKWKRNKNQFLWQEFDKQCTRISKLCQNLSFEYVKSHNTNVWNNLADKLASEISKNEQ